ncbi:hypothetical protein COCNU_08G003690 [Cocos nucifera]|uniref:Uncharacterized protein n=1 Tax=Cocos nucifera TaxID=13894 RepID=A0A8K0IH41_COCNU|nr:hypothetical protein COCNU_08G003690 [Cocos nucifera]
MDIHCNYEHLQHKKFRELGMNYRCFKHIQCPTYELTRISKTVGYKSVDSRKSKGKKRGKRNAGWGALTKWSQERLSLAAEALPELLVLVFVHLPLSLLLHAVGPDRSIADRIAGRVLGIGFDESRQRDGFWMEEEGKLWVYLNGMTRRRGLPACPAVWKINTGRGWDGIGSRDRVLGREGGKVWKMGLFGEGWEDSEGRRRRSCPPEEFAEKGCHYGGGEGLEVCASKRLPRRRDELSR